METSYTLETHNDNKIQFALSYRQLLREYVDNNLIVDNQELIKKTVEEEGFSEFYHERLLDGVLDNVLLDFAFSDSGRFLKKCADGKEEYKPAEREDIDAAEVRGLMTDYFFRYLGKEVSLKN